MSPTSLLAGKGPVLLAVIWIWAGLATCLYILRARKAARAPQGLRSLFGFRWDFIWVTIGYVNALIANAFLTVSVVYGTGSHQDSLNEHGAVYSALWSWIGQVCAIFSLVWARFAVIAFLCALQGKTYRKWRYTLYAVGAAQGLINAIEVGLILNQCNPVQRLWDHSIPGTCALVGVTSKVGFLQGSIGAFADFFLALYPPAVVIGPLQQMKMRIKIALCLIMGGGVMAGIAGIVKTISIESITHTDDISYATVDLLIWVMTEVWFVIIFGSLPTIRAVLYSAGRGLKAMTHPSNRKTSASKASPPPSYEHQVEWMELSGKASEGATHYGRVHGPTKSVVRANDQGDNLARKDGLYQTRGWPGKDSSEEEILQAGHDDIVVTTELRVTRDSEDIPQSKRQIESDAV